MDRRGTPPNVRAIAAASFVLAFVVRWAWVVHVQSPLDAEYSDMAGYVTRAEWLLRRQLPDDPRLLVTYPFGTHGILALEFLVLGRHARSAIAVLHALIGAIPAACAPVLTVRLLPRRWAAALVGVLVALWYPQICFAGFFLSEIWFSAAIALHACLAVRDSRRVLGRLAVGVVSAFAFVVRPQFLLTWAIGMAARALVLLRRQGARRATRAVAWLALPMILTLGASSIRLRAYSGHWGLIAESGINRVWADTDICRLEANWVAPNGARYNYWFSPPSKQPCPARGTVVFDGFIADSTLLDRIRREHLRGVSWSRRAARALANVRLLVAGNRPWPESNYKAPPRGALQDWFAGALTFVVLPLSALGLLLGPRNFTSVILAANLATVVVAAAVFFGEARYHVPYDPFAILLAVVGAHQVVARSVALVKRWGHSR